MYIKWNEEDSTADGFPSSMIVGEGNWLPFVEGPAVSNARTQTTEYVYDVQGGYVTQVIIGDATLAYDQAREGAHAPIADQLDKLWHDIDNGTLSKDGQFYNYVKDIKDQFPKE